MRAATGSDLGLPKRGTRVCELHREGGEEIS